MDMQSFTLPEWLPWWAAVAALLPVALYLALFLLMPFHTYGLRGRLAMLEARLEEIHEEIRVLTLRLPERGLEPHDLAPRARPPIPPATHEPGPREPGPRGAGFGDPVADRMLAYMRDKAQSDMQRAAPGPRAAPQLGPRGRAEPRLGPGAPPLPPDGGPPYDDMPPDAAPPPRAPRVPGRFGRRPNDEDRDEPRIDWPR